MCDLFCDWTLGSYSHHTNKNGTIIFFVETWTNPISCSQECYVSVNCWGQTVVEQKGCIYMVDADEMETKYKISAYFRIFLKYGKGPNLSLKMMIAETVG